MKSKKEERQGLEYINLKGHKCVVDEYINTHNVVILDLTENVRYRCRWMDLHNKRASHICANDLSVLEPKQEISVANLAEKELDASINDSEGIESQNAENIEPTVDRMGLEEDFSAPREEKDSRIAIAVACGVALLVGIVICICCL